MFTSYILLDLALFTSLVTVSYITYQKIIRSSKYHFINALIKTLLEKSKTSAEFYLNPGDKSCNITYHKMNETYMVNLPFDAANIRNYKKHKVFLNRGSDTIEITQQPGVKYMITADDFNGDSITIVNERDPTVTYRLNRDELVQNKFEEIFS